MPLPASQGEVVAVGSLADGPIEAQEGACSPLAGRGRHLGIGAADTAFRLPSSPSRSS
jgi:hypothetical protein